LVNPESQITSWAYDAGSRVTVQRLANGVRVSNSYDKADHINRLANIASGGTTLSSFSYQYNAVGMRTRVIESNGDRVTWSFDKIYQLTVERRSGVNAYALSYAYDGAGNRTRLLNAGSPTSYLYDAANQLTRSQAATGITTNTFDGAGNLAKSLAPLNQRTTNTWDGESRLTRVALPSGIVNTFTFSGDGQRVQKVDSSGTTKHVWDGENILLETDGSNVVQVVYTLEPALYGNLVSQRRSGATSIYLFDALGSTRELASSTGSVTDSYVYDSFGNILLTSGSTINWFRFIGHSGCYYDIDIGDYNLRARFYGAAIGRFLSRDPLESSNRSNGYVYSFNNPAVLSDPSGLQAIPTKLTLDPVGDCEKRDNCGGALYKVKFNLTGPPPVNIGGSVIQKVTMTLKCQKCDGTPCTVPTWLATGTAFYYEIWTVTGVDVIPASNWDTGGTAKWNDAFLNCGRPKTCGSFDIAGEVGFLQGYKWQNHRNYWLKPRQAKRIPEGADPCDEASQKFLGSGPWGTLRHSDFSDPEPFRWNTIKKQQHTMHVSWDCCTGCPKPDDCPKPSDPACVPKPPEPKAG
jgi:RHS repeat-associated protein